MEGAPGTGNRGDLGNDPARLIGIVKNGWRRLLACGTLPPFFIANDVARCFGMVPALFGAVILALGAWLACNGRARNPIK